MLNKILAAKGSNRILLIQEFQDYIWNENKLPYDAEVVGLLRDLAYDLDFCETDNSIENEIKSVLKKL